MSLDNGKSLAENLKEELNSKENDISDESTEFANRELDVFISYSTLNKNVADAVVSNFEQHGIRCWYAPRDIMPGQEWVTAIHEAINACKLFVLIYTDSSNESKQVANEVALAFNSGKTLIPFRLSETEMSTELEYYLTRVHWLDAVKPPLMQSIESLRVYSEKILRGEKFKEARIKNAPQSGKKGTQVPSWVLPIIIVLALGLLTVAIVLLVKEMNVGVTPNNNNIVTDGNSANGANNANNANNVNDSNNSINQENSIDENTVDENTNGKTNENTNNDIKDDTNNPTSIVDNNQTGDSEEQPTAEYIFQKAYEIQMNDFSENRYELAYDEYMKTGDADTTTPEIAEAMAELAGRFSREDGVPLDYEKAIKLYEKAILSGSASALNSMGVMYHNGDGVETNAAKALEYYIKAAELGDVNAMLNAGSLYQYGEENVAIDVDEALKYYKMAADKGDASAAYLYDLLETSQNIYHMDGNEGDEDNELHDLEAAYNGGKSLTAEDYYLLAYYYDSDSEEKDRDKVIKYAFEGANAGSADCMIILGDAYWYGNGVEQDYNKVLEWFGKAIDTGLEGFKYNYCVNGITALLEEGHISKDAASKWIDVND